MCGMPMEKVARACMICSHFMLDLGSEGYSELTPGSPAEIKCAVAGKSGCAWPRYGDDASPRALRTIAEKCARFELHPALSRAAPDDWNKPLDRAWTKLGD